MAYLFLIVEQYRDLVLWCWLRQLAPFFTTTYGFLVFRTPVHTGYSLFDFPVYIVNRLRHKL